ncbi:PIN domain-containing protein [Prosthecobacter sp. SYSU 5D2]|uniref:PIN domain-containing protein n=1 Tax=Prosthecobacter sp. SYSU 5D2 TaxID=3134134 RepID=UPI0031FF4139
MEILLDSAVYIGLMRAGKDPRHVLGPYLRAGSLYSCGVVRAEVLRGTKEPKRYEQMEQFFDIIPEVPTDPRLWRHVSQIGWDLGRKGKWPPVTDITIAACAMRARLTLISPDGHFDDVEGLKLLKELPESL